MSIRTVKVIRCNGCGRRAQIDNMWLPAVLKGKGWTIKGELAGPHYCPSCTKRRKGEGK